MALSLVVDNSSKEPLVAPQRGFQFKIMTSPGFKNNGDYATVIQIHVKEDGNMSCEIFKNSFATSTVDMHCICCYTQHENLAILLRDVQKDHVVSQHLTQVAEEFLDAFEQLLYEVEDEEQRRERIPFSNYHILPVTPLRWSSLDEPVYHERIMVTSNRDDSITIREDKTYRNL